MTALKTLGFSLAALFAALLLALIPQHSALANWSEGDVTSIGQHLRSNYEPSGMVYQDRLDWLFVASDEGYISAINPENGTLLHEWRPGGDIEGLAIADHDSNLLYYVHESGVVYEFDFSQGARTGNSWNVSQWLDGSGGAGAEGMSFLPNGYAPYGGSPYADAEMGGLFILVYQATGDQYFFDFSNGQVDLVDMVPSPSWVTDAASVHYEPLTHSLTTIYAGYHLSETYIDGVSQGMVNIGGTDTEAFAMTLHCGQLGTTAATVFTGDDKTHEVLRYDNVMVECLELSEGVQPVPTPEPEPEPTPEPEPVVEVSRTIETLVEESTSTETWEESSTSQDYELIESDVSTRVIVTETTTVSTYGVDTTTTTETPVTTILYSDGSTEEVIGESTTSTTEGEAYLISEESTETVLEDFVVPGVYDPDLPCNEQSTEYEGVYYTGSTNCQYIIGSNGRYVKIYNREGEMIAARYVYKKVPKEFDIQVMDLYEDGIDEIVLISTPPKRSRGRIAILQLHEDGSLYKTGHDKIRTPRSNTPEIQSLNQDTGVLEAAFGTRERSFQITASGKVYDL